MRKGTWKLRNTNEKWKGRNARRRNGRASFDQHVRQRLILFSEEESLTNLKALLKVDEVPKVYQASKPRNSGTEKRTDSRAYVLSCAA